MQQCSYAYSSTALRRPTQRDNCQLPHITGPCHMESVPSCSRLLRCCFATLLQSNACRRPFHSRHPWVHTRTQATLATGGTAAAPAPDLSLPGPGSMHPAACRKLPAWYLKELLLTSKRSTCGNLLAAPAGTRRAAWPRPSPGMWRQTPARGASASGGRGSPPWPAPPPHAAPPSQPG